MTYPINTRRSVGPPGTIHNRRALVNSLWITRMHLRMELSGANIPEIWGQQPHLRQGRNSRPQGRWPIIRPAQQVEAGVARPTVFAAVGPKPTLLKLVVDYATTGDDAHIPVAERTWSREALEAVDPPMLAAGSCGTGAAGAIPGCSTTAARARSLPALQSPCGGCRTPVRGGGDCGLALVLRVAAEHNRRVLGQRRGRARAGPPDPGLRLPRLAGPRARDVTQAGCRCVPTPSSRSPEKARAGHLHARGRRGRVASPAGCPAPVPGSRDDAEARQMTGVKVGYGTDLHLGRHG